MRQSSCWTGVYWKRFNTIWNGFRVLFAETMLFYGLCDIFVVALKVFYSFDALQHPVAVAVDTMFTHTYAMIMPLQSCCLVERLAATLLFHSYEKNRKWPLLVLSQPFCIAFIYLQNLVREGERQVLSPSNGSFPSFAIWRNPSRRCQFRFATSGFTDDRDAFIFLAYYIIQVTVSSIWAIDSDTCHCRVLKGVVTLIIINRRRTRKYTGGRVSLSTRYQLAENIRTLRWLLSIGFASLRRQRYTNNRKHIQCLIGRLKWCLNSPSVWLQIEHVHIWLILPI